MISLLLFPLVLCLPAFCFAAVAWLCGRLVGWMAYDRGLGAWHRPGGGVEGQRECPTCQGSGINPKWPTKVCPKCEGERVVSKS